MPQTPLEQDLRTRLAPAIPGTLPGRGKWVDISLGPDIVVLSETPQPNGARHIETVDIPTLLTALAGAAVGAAYAALKTAAQNNGAAGAAILPVLDQLHAMGLI